MYAASKMLPIICIAIRDRINPLIQRPQDACDPIVIHQPSTRLSSDLSQQDSTNKITSGAPVLL